MQPSAPQKHLWLWVFPAMTLPLCASFLYFVWLGDSPLARMVYGGTKLFTLIWPVLVCFWVFKEPLPTPDFSVLKKTNVWVWGLGSGIAIGLAMLLAMKTPLGAMVAHNSGNIEQKVRDLGFYNHFLEAAIAISVVHSLLEEYYWRWFVFGKLAELVPIHWAHALAGISFAAHHVVVLDQYFPLYWAFVLGAGVGLGGVIWSVQYRLTQTLLGCWLSHMLVDFTIMWIGAALLFH